MATLSLFSREGSSPMNSAILVSGSHPQSLCDTLASQSCTAEAARSGADALARVESKRFDLVLLDPKLPDLDAEEVRRMMKLQQPDLPVFLLDFATGRLIQSEPVSDPLQQALLALQPASGEEAVCETALIEPEPEICRQSDPLLEPLPDMVGRSLAMGQVYRLSRMVARRDASVLLEGESGTGKELVARAIHQLSTRAKQPMVTVNCAAIPESLLESELFGYVRGAFTGAVQSKLGRIHAAHGGTLFLDEIGDLPLSMQAKLLRFLQEGEVQRLGSPDVFRVDVRVIAATNADLKERIKRTEFRQDLYYRLSVFPIHIPTLHERNDDVISLATYFLAHFCRQAKMPQKTLHTSVRSMLLQYAWPGNVRELQHAIERAFILADEDTMVRPEHFLLQ
jgi:transcriptional regulator with GAF, ATPase, and Fis domain